MCVRVQVHVALIEAHRLGFNMHRDRLYAIILKSATCKWVAAESFETMVAWFHRQQALKEKAVSIQVVTESISKDVLFM